LMPGPGTARSGGWETLVWGIIFFKVGREDICWSSEHKSCLCFSY